MPLANLWWCTWGIYMPYALTSNYFVFVHAHRRHMWPHLDTMQGQRGNAPFAPNPHPLLEHTLHRRSSLSRSVVHCWRSSTSFAPTPCSAQSQCAMARTVSPFVFDKVRVGDCPARHAHAEAFLNIFESEGWWNSMSQHTYLHNQELSEISKLRKTNWVKLANLEKPWREFEYVVNTTIN